MNMINYFSNAIIPIIITVIVIYGLREKIGVFDSFIEGAKEGIEIVVGLFPTLVGLFVAIGVLRASGIIDILIGFLEPILQNLNIPREIMPLAILRPISRKCFSCNWDRYNEKLWSGQYNRNDNINYNGFN